MKKDRVALKFKARSRSIKTTLSYLFYKFLQINSGRLLFFSINSFRELQGNIPLSFNELYKERWKNREICFEIVIRILGEFYEKIRKERFGES